MLFLDREDAGAKLAEKLQLRAHKSGDVVLGLARGGVVVAAAVAKALHLPLGVLVVKKVGAPGNPELALGATTKEGCTLLNDSLIALLGVSKEYLVREVERQKRAASQKEELYFAQALPPKIEGKRAIVVDDGIATGASMRVAIKAVRSSGASHITLAIPVAAPDSLEQIRSEVDEVVCLHAPEYFEAVGAFYKEFEQVEDEEVISLLSQNRPEAVG